MGLNGKGRRVAVTGLGVVSSLGTGVQKFWTAIKKGENGIKPIEGFPLQDLYISIGGEVRDFDPKVHCNTKPLLLADRYSQYAGAAAQEDVRQSGLETPFKNGERAASIVGSGIGGLSTLEKAYEDLFIHKKKATHPLSLLRTIGSSAAAHVSIDHGIRGPVFGTVSACSTAAHAIGLAFQLIRSGAVDVAVAGAGEAAITFGSMRAWQAMRVLSPDGCFPFAKRRNGTVLGEGAGILVLEDLQHAQARGAAVLAELCGFGMTSDAADMVNPDVEGPTRAMQIALAGAQLSPGDIDYLNAHGTATAANDLNETRAIKKVFGAHANRLSVSSTKSMHGHCLGAGGGVEAVACIQAMLEGFVPPTMGFDEPGDECDLDYTPNEGRYREIGYTMSNSFAFGGLNAVLVFGPAPN
ncbi:MAG: beta-ketoacyl-[acyl-carrier-protein] synthase family protein [Rhodomicrobium sp.]|nr:beta-ketoacyl-[acyl-carrier-protein] synthase family protein [Rhodomicrobium sp.]